MTLEVLQLIAVALLLGGIALKMATSALSDRVARLKLCSEYLMDEEEDYEDEEYDIG